MVRKDKLYTVNKWNKNLFFSGGWSGNEMNYLDSLDLNDLENDPYASTFASKNNYFGGSGEGSGGFQGSGWLEAGKAIGATLGELGDRPMRIGGVDTRHGAWDYMDPTYHIADGLESEVGNSLSDAGVNMTKNSMKTGNWQEAATGALLKVIGSGYNTLWGSKLNKERIDRINKNNQRLNEQANILSQVTDMGTFLKETEGRPTDFNFSQSDIGKDGVWSTTAKDEYERLAAQQQNARERYRNAFTFSAKNIDDIADNAKISNFVYDLGGMLTNKYQGGGKKKRTYVDVWKDPTRITTLLQYEGGSPDYYEEVNYDANGNPVDTVYTKFPNHDWFFGLPDKEVARSTKPEQREKYLQLKKEFNEGRKGAKQGNIGWNKFKDSINDLFGTNFAFGGDLQTNGGDYSTGLTHINAGSSHELNPNEGVQMGVDSKGTPNLVEEGEVVFDDYVYSARIPCDEATKKKFHFPKKKEITYADLAKKLEEEIKERPNDPISEAGFKAQMHTLAEEQERQKSEMEAERARAAFEALSPEEKVAVMQQKAQEEAVQQNLAEQQAIAEQQAAMGQMPPEAAGAIPEEVALAQEGNDLGSVPVEPTPDGMGVVAAEGGRLFKKGGYKWDDFWKKINAYSKLKGNTKGKYKVDTKSLTKKQIEELQNSKAYKDFTKYILNDATDAERLKYFQWIDANTGRDNKYLDKDGKLIEGWQDAYQTARNDGLYGIQHYTPEWNEGAAEAAVAAEPQQTREPKIYHAVEGDDDYLPEDQSKWVNVGEVIDPNGVIVNENGDKVIYHKAKESNADNAVNPDDLTIDNTGKLVPKYRNESLRYAGLFGPAVGLGMMAAGIGKPDYSRLDAAVDRARNVHLATYKPLGNYLRYNPMDIWAEQNRLDSIARAADRTIMNSSLPTTTKLGMLLAANYNNQVANGDLHRKALEYNDNKRAQTAEYNRGTDRFNAEAFKNTSQFNTSALNQAEQLGAHLAMQAAQQRLQGDASWYNSLYGNVGNLFKGMSDLGRENAQWNMIADLAADGYFGNLGKSYTGQKIVGQKAKGGKLKKKRKGLTI